MARTVTLDPVTGRFSQTGEDEPKEYSPSESNEIILDRAMEHVKSIPYSASLRWVFYRLFQDGIYTEKEDIDNLTNLTSKARKGFYDEWRPYTLIDDTRGVIPGGNGFDDDEEWLEELGKLKFVKDKWLNQEYYIEVWFEAKAMSEQFKYYTKETPIPLLAFGGDISIAEKWKAAKRLEWASKEYGKPIVILYFGDCDKKGDMIPKSALDDITKWCSVDFDFIRVGLNKGDGESLGLPEKPEKPGTYQWEALSDTQAGELITTAIDKYYDKEALAEVEKEEKEITDEFQERFKGFIEKWDNRNNWED